MKKLTLALALVMITGVTFAQEKACCKKKGSSAACCKDKKNCPKDNASKDAPKKEVKQAK